MLNTLHFSHVCVNRVRDVRAYLPRLGGKIKHYRAAGEVTSVFIDGWNQAQIVDSNT